MYRLKVSLSFHLEIWMSWENLMLITDQYLKCTYYVLLLILRPYNLNTLDIQPYNNLLDKGKSFIFFLNAENFSTPLG